MSYIVEFNNIDGEKRRRVISNSIVNKVPRFKDNIDLLDDNVFSFPNVYGDIDTVLDILEGKIESLTDITDEHLKHLINLSDFLNIDPRYIIYVDVDRFASFFKLDRYPLRDALGNITNIDIDIYKGGSDIETLKLILKADYISRKFYVDFAFHIINSFKPKNYIEHYLVETIKAIIIRNTGGYNRNPINKKEFDAIFSRRRPRKTALYIEY